MASARDCGTSSGVNFSTSTEAQTGTNISETSTNTASLNLRDSTSQIDGPTMMNTMAQAKPMTDTAMAGVGPTTEEASTLISSNGKDFSTQSNMAMAGSDFGASTDMTSVKTAGIMTSPTQKTNATSQFHSTTTSSSTMSAPCMQDLGTSPPMTGSSTRQTQYESTTISKAINTRE